MTVLAQDVCFVINVTIILTIAYKETGGPLCVLSGSKQELLENYEQYCYNMKHTLLVV